MGEFPGQPDQQAEYLTDELDGPRFEEAMYRLLTGELMAITVNGHRMIAVSSRGLNRENWTVTLGTRDDAGQRHEFTYTLDTDSTISHEILDDGSRER